MEYIHSSKYTDGPLAFVLGMRQNFRGEELVDSLKSIGFNVIICLAKPSTTQGNSRNRDLRHKLIGRDLSKSEIGCLESHDQILKNSFLNEKEIAFIFEDDAILTFGFIKHFNEIIDNFKVIKKPSILSLSYSIRLLGVGNRFSKLIKVVKTTDLLKLKVPPYGTMAYIVNKSAIDIIKKEKLKYISPADWPYEWSGAIKYFSTRKPLVIHPEVSEDLIAKEQSKETNTRRKPLSDLKYLKNLAKKIISIYIESRKHELRNPRKIVRNVFLIECMHANFKLFSKIYNIETFPFLYKGEKWQYFYRTKESLKS